MLKNHLFFFKRYFDFFKNKCLVAGLMFLGVLILICCFPEPPPSRYLSVPHITQQYYGWCGAACIQMWAYYEMNHPTQEEIAQYVGWSGSNVYAIADGVTQFTSKTGFAKFYNNTSDQQDVAVSAQVAAIRSGVPSISIVDYGYHAVIVIGFEWTNMPDGRPRADFITFNDPLLSDSSRVGAWTWKQNRFWPNSISNKYEIVLTNHSYVDDGYEGHQEFKVRGGTYYGAPGGGGGGKDPIEY